MAKQYVKRQVHTLPRPQRPLDPRHHPFVGNRTTDDNLAEAVEVALWNVLGRGEPRPEIAAHRGIVTLGGRLGSKELCAACERAAIQVAGVRKVRNQVRTED